MRRKRSVRWETGGGGTGRGGVQVHVTDREVFEPVRTGIGLLVTAKKVWPDFAWREDLAIDRLSGSATVRKMVDAGAGTDAITAAWAAELARFRRTRRKYLLYR
ncbi:hypothetical protein ADL27_12705 [Streptomyces sp. NRRL F-6602]|nr:hypothetical protein ADL27_12705 [Streptomyces sp. NRRL F-6602]